ncbi:hypothetical protein RNJ44_00349 [Nakaseomyces bracarensis]|uniref:Uncharacterized protein n=1 Tax=Nakaseomyces bracarensis TaxID=273131 RepID=A0ABR4NSN7_9SACH
MFILGLLRRYHNGHIYMNIRPKQDWGLLSALVLSTVANGLVPAISSILIGRVFQLLDHTTHEFEFSQLYHELIVRAMAILILGLASMPLNWASLSCWMVLGERQGLRVRKLLVDKYLSLPCQWYDKYRATLLGEFTQLHRCIEEVRSGSAEASAIVTQSIVAICALLGTAFYYSWSLTLIILCTSPIIVICAVLFSRYIHVHLEFENSASAKAAERLNWIIDHVNFVRIHNGTHVETNIFDHYIQISNTHYIKSCLYVSLNISILRFLSLVMFVQGFWFGSTMIKKGKLSINDVITSFHSCLMIGTIINTALGQIVVMQKGDVALKKLNIILNIQEETDNGFIVDIVGIESMPITFQNVSFSYPERPKDEVLNKLFLEFPANKITYLIGKSGYGKSTLFDLLMLHYNNYMGDILLGDNNIKTISKGYLYKNITFIEQETILFDDTLRNNILITKIGDINSQMQLDEMLKKACSFALLDALVNDLPSGLDTIIGTGGIELSGGQKQKIALARAFIRNTPILIMDEPLSAIDINQRIVLLERIKNWRNHMTTVIITHDKDMLSQNDNIIHIDNNDPQPSETLTLFGTTVYRENHTINAKTKIYEYNQNFARIYDKQIESKIDFPETLYSYELASVNEEITYSSDSDEGATKISCDVENGEEPQLLSLTFIILLFFKQISNKMVFLVGVMGAILSAICNPLFSYMFSFLLNGLTPGQDGVGSAKYLLRYSIIVISIAVFDGTTNFIKSYILGSVCEFWIMHLRRNTFDRVVNAPFEWFANKESSASKISTLLMNDLRDLRSLLTEFLSAVITLLFLSSMGFIWAIIVGWKLSLVCISFIPLVVLVTGAYGSILVKYETSYKTAVAMTESNVHQMVLASKTIKSLQLQTYIMSQYNRFHCKLEIIGKRRAILTGLGISLTNVLVMLMQSVIFLYGIKLVLRSEYSTRKFFEVLTLLLFTIITTSSLINQIPDMARGKRAITYVQRILNDPLSNDIRLNGTGIEMAPLSENSSLGSVHIHRLSYAFPQTPSMLVLKSIHLNLFSGKVYGIVGKSGSGKTTLINILAGLYKVEAGHISILGKDISTWNRTELYNAIGLLEQHPVLRFDTIRGNLVYGLKREILEQEILEALDSVGMLDFVMSLPEELEELLDSSLLSGGQAQRLCLAREIIRAPRVLILDECTSALDESSAQLINEMLGSHLAEITIVVSHNIKTIRQCDEIIVLDHGIIIQQGTFESLNSSCPQFRTVCAT